MGADSAEKEERLFGAIFTGKNAGVTQQDPRDTDILVCASSAGRTHQ